MKSSPRTENHAPVKRKPGRPHGTKRSDKVKVTVHISKSTSAYLKADAKRRDKFMGDAIDDAVAVAIMVRGGFSIK